MSWDGDDADRGWDEYQDMLDRQEAELIEEFGRIRDDTDHYGVGAECFVCRRPWPCPAALTDPVQLELGEHYRETDTVRPNPDYL